MNSISEMWQRLSGAARIGLITGVLAIIALMLALAWWVYRPDYQVLFSDLAARDAAAMTAELDKMKTPYQLSEGGNTILVPKDLVYKTRLKLMGKDVPLHGAVGFEVFNNADFGMTEFVQKVNYLRAIQGELTRTIVSIEDIQSARVHLALPEQGLFKKAVTKPKASVTLTMKPGHVLTAEQITGIQRLVAASVPDIVANDVTLLDQHGMALTRVADANSDSALAQLDSRRSTEEYLAKKVTQVLDRTFGPGEAIASVDVALNMDQNKITTEEVLPAKRAQDANPAGVVVRERYASREGEVVSGAKNAANNGNANANAASGNSANTTSEFDYQVGRRIEQLSIASGTVKRMTVAVLVKQPLNETQVIQLKEVIASSVGINSQRGDAVVVYSMDKFVNPNAVANLGAGANSAASANAMLATSDSAATHHASSSAQTSAQTRTQSAQERFLPWIVAGLLAAILLVVLMLNGGRQRAPAVATLDDAAREQLLERIRQLTSQAHSTDEKDGATAAVAGKK